MSLETKCHFPTLISHALTMRFFQVLMALSCFLGVHLLVPKDFATCCQMNLIFVVPCIMLNSEINPTRCNNCVYSSQWLYSLRRINAIVASCWNYFTIHCCQILPLGSVLFIFPSFLLSVLAFALLCYIFSHSLILCYCTNMWFVKKI